jgi:hypothetical protein
MIEVPISHLLEEAHYRSLQMPENEETVRTSGGRQAGALGELIAMEHLKRCGVFYEEVFNKEHDVKFENLGKTYTLEFKTKERTVVPQPHYDCSVFEYSHKHQNPDYYMFMSLVSTDSRSKSIDRFVRGFIVGSADRKTFEEKSVLLLPGYVDPSNGFIVKKSTHNIKISNLQPPLGADNLCLIER